MEYNKLYNFGPSLFGVAFTKRYAKMSEILGLDGKVNMEMFNEFIKNNYEMTYFAIEHSFASWNGVCYDEEEGTVYLIVGCGIFAEKQFELVKSFCESRLEEEDDKLARFLLAMHRLSADNALTEIKRAESMPWENIDECKEAFDEIKMNITVEKNNCPNEFCSERHNPLFDEIVKTFGLD